MITIGSKKIATNIFLAPLAGCTDLSFRLIAREHGAQFCFFEMIDANSLIYMRRKNLEILKTHKDDAPIGAQLLGSDPAAMLAAAEKLLTLIDPVFLDINAACPAKKVIKKKAGSHLLQDPDRLCEIIKKLAAALPLPITVKLRVGYDKKDPEAIAETARRCEDSGASAIFVHGRTKSQGYSGDIDYDSIKTIKNKIKVPLFGIGNILTPDLAKAMFDKTGCDGIMVARGSLGNPWIFKDIENYLKDGTEPAQKNHAMRLKALKKHLSYIERYKNNGIVNKMGEMRKVALWYLKGFPGAPRIRDRICRTKGYAELIEAIDTLFVPTQ